MLIKSSFPLRSFAIVQGLKTMLKGKKGFHPSACSFYMAMNQPGRCQETSLLFHSTRASAGSIQNMHPESISIGGVSENCADTVNLDLDPNDGFRLSHLQYPRENRKFAKQLHFPLDSKT